VLARTRATPDALAALARLPPRRVHAVVTGRVVRVTVRDVAALSVALRCTPDWLLALSEEGPDMRALCAAFAAMRSRPGAEPGRLITKAEAADYYLDYPSNGRDMWLKLALKDDQMREFVLNRHFDDLRTQLPAIAFTLNHLYRGGFYGLLTARGDRDNSHAAQVQMIGEVFGFVPLTELIYYVNDSVKGERLSGSSAEKKATILTNFANGIKEDKAGFFEPMVDSGLRFFEQDEVVRQTSFPSSFAG
jgi:hypothetical protein